MTLNLEQLPKAVTDALERKAAQEGKTVPEVALEAMARGLGVNGNAKRDSTGISGSLSEEDARAIDANVRKFDLSDIAGSWVEDPEFDEAMKDFERIDPEAELDN